MNETQEIFLLNQANHELKKEIHALRKILWAIIKSNSGKLKMDIKKLQSFNNKSRLEREIEDHGNIVWFKAIYNE